MEKLPISVSMLVKNSEKYLAKSLASLADFAEIILLDNGSTDNTLSIAEQFENVKIYKHSFIGFGAMKNMAASLASYDWILNIDSDEIFSSELVDELKTINLSDIQKVYSILRINHYRGKPIKTCGWYPDYVNRLYNRQAVQFNNKFVHESLIIPNGVEVIKLRQYFTHYSFENCENLIHKMQQYTSLFAEQQKFKQKSSVLSAICHGIASFFKSYILKKGILSGKDGFIISFANACGSYYKYIKLTEANETLTVSLIITTYNRPDALALVLQSVLKQEILPNEVIIADDGSNEETAKTIKHFQRLFPIPLKHAWQPDDGFRLAQSRNQALAVADFDYIIVIDGDMVLHPKFISDHKTFAQKGIFVQGNRVVLTQSKTEELLKKPEQYRILKWYEKNLEKRFEKRFSAIRIPFLAKCIWNKKKSSYYKGIRGCNMAFFKEDAYSINGFNNQFIGWGREDSEFVARFFNNGGKRADLKFSAIAYHLWHYEAMRNSLPENDLLLKKTIQEKLSYCENGVKEIISYYKETNK